MCDWRKLVYRLREMFSSRGEREDGAEVENVRVGPILPLATKSVKYLVQPPDPHTPADQIPGAGAPAIGVTGTESIGDRSLKNLTLKEWGLLGALAAGGVGVGHLEEKWSGEKELEGQRKELEERRKDTHEAWEAALSCQYNCAIQTDEQRDTCETTAIQIEREKLTAEALRLDKKRIEIELLQCLGDNGRTNARDTRGQ